MKTRKKFQSACVLKVRSWVTKNSNKKRRGEKNIYIYYNALKHKNVLYICFYTMETA